MSQQYFVLLSEDTERISFLKLPQKHYLFLVTENYFNIRNKNDFTTKEKLFITNNSTKVTWKRITIIKALVLKIFFNAISPLDFKIEIIEGKVMYKIKNAYMRR